MSGVRGHEGKYEGDEKDKEEESPKRGDETGQRRGNERVIKGPFIPDEEH